MRTNQTASNRLHPPAHAGTATGGVGSGFFDPMEKQRLIEKLAETIATQEDLDALKSLLNERKTHLMYRQLDREYYFPEQPKTEEKP